MGKIGEGDREVQISSCKIKKSRDVMYSMGNTVNCCLSVAQSCLTLYKNKQVK